MSGHWTGITNPDGSPYNGDFNHIVNYAEPIIADTVEQMYGMIWYLADYVVGEIESGGDHRENTLRMIDEALTNYEKGVTLGRKNEQNTTVVAKKELRKMIDGEDVINAIIVKLIEAGVIDPTKKVK